jgi:phosphoribosylanthranilate isomerase
MERVATRIKHCGITSLEDAERAAAAGAWALGMIFWDGSPRRCELAEAQLVGAALRRTLLLTGVFVNATLEEIDATVQAAGLSLVQLHGDEGPAYCAEVARRTGARVMKAVRVKTAAELRALRSFHTDYHLLDTARAGLYGGTGEIWDWSLLKGFDTGAPVLLSGGLTPENAGEAIAAAAPFGLDVSSGVEVEPGIKDHVRMRAFVDAVHEIDPPAPKAPLASEAVEQPEPEPEFVDEPEATEEPTEVGS